jgi:hypothetical protein
MPGNLTSKLQISSHALDLALEKEKFSTPGPKIDRDGA